MVDGVGLGFNIELLTLVKVSHLLTDEVRPSFQFMAYIRQCFALALDPFFKPL